MQIPALRSNEDFDSTGYFRPYVQQWIVNTDSKTTQWVNNVSAVFKPDSLYQLSRFLGHRC